MRLEAPDNVVAHRCGEAQSAEFGARNLRRVIQEQVEIPITQMIAGGVAAGKTVLRCLVDGERVRVIAE